MAERYVFAIIRLANAGLLVWALARHPIGYYTVLRVITTAVSLYSIYICINGETRWLGNHFCRGSSHLPADSSTTNDPRNVEIRRRNNCCDCDDIATICWSVRFWSLIGSVDNPQVPGRLLYLKTPGGWLIALLNSRT